MCTFENEHSVLVCDTAIQGVRKAVGAAFGDAIQFTPAPGQGTRVKAPPIVDDKAFQEVTREAIAAAQKKKATGTQLSCGIREVFLQVLPLAPKEPYARGIEALNMAHRSERATRKMGDAHETTS